MLPSSSIMSLKRFLVLAMIFISCQPFLVTAAVLRRNMNRRQVRNSPQRVIINSNPVNTNVPAQGMNNMLLSNLGGMSASRLGEVTDLANVLSLNGVNRLSGAGINLGLNQLNTGGLGLGLGGSGRLQQKGAISLGNAQGNGVGKIVLEANGRQIPITGLNININTVSNTAAPRRVRRVRTGHSSASKEVPRGIDLTSVDSSVEKSTSNAPPTASAAAGSAQNELTRDVTDTLLNLARRK